MAISPIGSNKINWARVKLLLLSNESRGRHSTGLYSNKSSLKMVKAATPFVKELVISPEADGITPLLGHTRAPSVGTDRSISGAQPIVEVDEEGENVFAIIHNGTIHNMEELADADDEITFVTTDTDTQILSKFIQQEKYSVLNEYYGAASLIWHTKKDPDAIYVFRGESSQSSYSAYVTEERPLHMGSDETGIYFSSTKDSLVEMFDSKEAKESVVEVVANKVLRFENGVESVIFEADRSTVSQTKKVVKAVTHNHHT
ncbi:MAG: hypothetical protein KAH32_09065, partial [Chlamydiia bacterium]|nr:hypothetical protein [Chlamydiia bacterium]